MDEEEKGRKRKAGDAHQMKNDPYIPFIPKFLYSLLDKDRKRNFTKCRKMVNCGETMGKEDLILGDKDEDPKTPSKKPDKKRGQYTHPVRTKVHSAGIKDDTLEVKLESSDSDYDLSLSSFKPRKRVVTFGDDSRTPSNPNHSMEDVKSSFIRMMKRETSVGMSKGWTRHHPYTVVDPGAERDLVGGLGWRVLHFSDKSETLNMALHGMGSKVFTKSGCHHSGKR